MSTVPPASTAGRTLATLLLAFAWLWGLGVPATVCADEPIAVVATIPVLRDLVQQIGQPYVRVTSLLTGLENEHSYSPKPSDLLAVRKARLLVEIGAGLEVWVSGLIRSAGNRDLAVVTTSHGIDLLQTDDIEPKVPHGASHRHATGNPHIWLDPDNVVKIVSRITEALTSLDPAHASAYAHNQATYLETLRRTTGELLERLRVIPDRRIVTHHPAWPYFARRFNLTIAGEIQTQSGAEPSPRRLQVLIEQIRRERIKVIVSEPQLNQKLPRLLAQESGARVAVLTPMPGGVPGTETYLDMLRYNVLQLVRAFEHA